MEENSPRKGYAHAPKYETAYARAAYEAYAAMGPTRSLSKLAKVWKGNQGTYESKLSYLSILSSRFRWQDRIKVYDQEQAEERAYRRELRWEKLNQEQDEIAVKAREIALKAIEYIADRKSLGAQNAVALLKIGMDAERTAVQAAAGVSKGNDSGRIQIVIMTDSDHADPRAIAGPTITAEVREVE